VTYGMGRVYTGTSDGHIVALDAESGTPAWSTAVGGVGQVHNPAYSDGVVYAGSDTAGLVALHAQDGSQAWPAVDLGGDVPGTTVVVDGVVYTGLGNTETGIGRLRAIDARTGALLWQAREAFQAPSVSNGVAYTTDITGVVVALRAKDGSEIWRIKLPNNAHPPAIAGDVTYSSEIDDGHVWARNAANGEPVWDLDVTGSIDCCSIVVDGYVIAPTSGTVYVIGGSGTP
jgi:outer membrane protein assembly factor BamB